jgi:uncharacterized protein (DUF2164 family)
MATIELDRATKDALIVKIQQYTEAELDRKLGSFEAEFLLDFFRKKYGAAFLQSGAS